MNRITFWLTLYLIQLLLRTKKRRRPIICHERAIFLLYQVRILTEGWPVMSWAKLIHIPSFSLPVNAWQMDFD
jgi:hypothetical protein